MGPTSESGRGLSMVRSKMHMPGARGVLSPRAVLTFMRIIVGPTEVALVVLSIQWLLCLDLGGLGSM